MTTKRASRPRGTEQVVGDVENVGGRDLVERTGAALRREVGVQKAAVFMCRLGLGRELLMLDELGDGCEHDPGRGTLRWIIGAKDDASGFLAGVLDREVWVATELDAAAALVYDNERLGTGFDGDAEGLELGVPVIAWSREVTDGWVGEVEAALLHFFALILHFTGSD